MAQSAVFLRKSIVFQYQQKSPKKQKLKFSRSALIHMKIRIWLKYFIHDGGIIRSGKHKNCRNIEDQDGTIQSVEFQREVNNQQEINSDLNQTDIRSGDYNIDRISGVLCDLKTNDEDEKKTPLKKYLSIIFITLKLRKRS